MKEDWPATVEQARKRVFHIVGLVKHLFLVCVHACTQYLTCCDRKLIVTQVKIL